MHSGTYEKIKQFNDGSDKLTIFPSKIVFFLNLATFKQGAMQI